MNAFLTRYIPWWRRLMAWFCRPVTNPRPLLAPVWPTVDPDHHRPKHHVGTATVPLGELFDRLRAEGANVGRLAHIVHGEPTQEMRDPYLFCGADNNKAVNA